MIYFHYEGNSADKPDLPDFIIKNEGKFSNNNKKLTCLGYYRQDKDVHFFLPRVFEETNIEEQTTKDVKKDLSTWLYSSIKRYREKKGTVIATEIEGDVISTSLNSNTNDTLLDHFLALENFYNRNKDLILLIYKESHRGYNRVNWAKTVRHCIPIISKKNGKVNVAYTEVFNERQHIHDQEELMVLFFSTLRYIQQEYNYPMPQNEYYTLMGVSKFETMVKNSSISPRLRAIRQQYFNDRMQELWNLLYAFHNKLESDNNDNICAGNQNAEYLLATNFDRVFEDMIDYLIGDPKLEKLKGHEDNRIIDHIFLGRSLFGGANSKVYYIADSKYYDPNNAIDGTSIAKQYDYARNIIQLVRDHVNHVKHEKKYDCIDMNVAKSYYDELTHGYNVTPNFFIRPNEDKKADETNKLGFKLHEEDGINKVNCVFQHKGCLFDRSTLFLLHFDINLSYVLEVYSKENTEERNKIRKEIENIVREKLDEYIKKEYDINEKKEKAPETLFNYDNLGKLFGIEGKLYMALPKNK